MVKINKLAGLITEKGYNKVTFAKAIGRAKQTFYDKINKGGNTFTVEEISNIVRVLELNKDDLIFIFFENSFSKNEISKNETEEKTA